MNHHNKDEIMAHDLPATAMDPEVMKAREEKIQVAMIGLCGCWGCTLSFLDMDENLLKLLEKVNITRSSFTDIKRIPGRAAVGFIEGGIANSENIETLEHFRENCDIMISVGACA
ncbi:MAG TPA: NADP oxidoreductase, partial [Rhodobacteraceae bacterium]|nr:NADP oxidoreductase [Paracoccaceae bacterium]